MVFKYTFLFRIFEIIVVSWFSKRKWQLKKIWLATKAIGEIWDKIQIVTTTYDERYALLKVWSDPRPKEDILNNHYQPIVGPDDGEEVAGDDVEIVADINPVGILSTVLVIASSRGIVDVLKTVDDEDNCATVVDISAISNDDR